MNDHSLTILMITPEMPALVSLSDYGSSPRSTHSARNVVAMFYHSNLKRLILMHPFKFDLHIFGFEAFEIQKSNQCALFHRTLFSEQIFEKKSSQTWPGMRPETSTKLPL
jgi:hypothetical protein